MSRSSEAPDGYAACVHLMYLRAGGRQWVGGAGTGAAGRGAPQPVVQRVVRRAAAAHDLALEVGALRVERAALGGAALGEAAQPPLGAPPAAHRHDVLLRPLPRVGLLRRRRRGHSSQEVAPRRGHGASHGAPYCSVLRHT